MKKSIFGFILAILLICPFMSQVLRAEARDTDSKVTDADKIFYYSFDKHLAFLTGLVFVPLANSYCKV